MFCASNVGHDVTKKTSTAQTFTLRFNSRQNRNRRGKNTSFTCNLDNVGFLVNIAGSPVGEAEIGKTEGHPWDNVHPS